jgi:hypothetical protein
MSIQYPATPVIIDSVYDDGSLSQQTISSTFAPFVISGSDTEYFVTITSGKGDSSYDIIRNLKITYLEGDYLVPA